MSNSTVSIGFQPARRIDGAAGNFMTNTYRIAYNNANTFGTGDVVYLSSSGYIDKAATNTNPMLGVFAYCQYANPANTIQPGVVRLWNAPTLASTTVVTAQVWDDPNLVFRIRANGTVYQTSIGLNATFVSNASPNTSTGISTVMLDTTTINTTSNLPLRIVGFAPDANNDPTSAYPVLEVVYNTSMFRQTTGQ